MRAKVAGAAKVGVDATMAACVKDAKDNHPGFPPASEPGERFHSRTGFQVGSIRIMEEATERTETEIVGQWGSDSEYGLYLEIGTSVAGPTAQERAAAGGGDMDAIPPPEGPLMAPRPYLRPAADRENSFLAARIGAVFRGEPLP